MDNFSFTNQISLSNSTVNCNAFNSPNNFGNYFKQCSVNNASPLWGSMSAVPENCMDPKNGTPCHNIWNNQTKRKIIVEYQR